MPTALYARLKSAVSAAEQHALSFELQSLVYEQALNITFWQTPRFMAVSDRVKHFIPYPGGHNEDFWTIRVASEKES